jgi:hypothetical protein
MIKLAVSKPALSVATEDLDADSIHQGVANGIVDLRPGELRAGYYVPS